MACYDNIIGLSRTDCPCIDTAPPENYNTSLSGLYLTDLAPLDTLEGLDECGAGSAWDMMTSARRDAISTFISDSNGMMMSNFSPKREKFAGQIGEGVGREVLTTSNTYAGIRVACNPMRGGRIKITKIGTLFSAAGTITLTIYNSLNAEVWSDTLNTSNGFTLNVLEEPIILPTFIEFASTHEYFFVYEYSAGNKPKQNKVNCGCGGFVPWFDTENPMWNKSGHSGGRAWANWIMVSGWTGDELDLFDNCAASGSTVLNGLSLQVDLGCDIGQVLCNGSLDFETDALAMSIAFAIQFKTAEIMAAKLLASTNLNRQNTINREHLKELRREWAGRYNANTKYVSEQASLNSIDCLTCRDDWGMQVKSVLT